MAQLSSFFNSFFSKKGNLLQPYTLDGSLFDGVFRSKNSPTLDVFVSPVRGVPGRIFFSYPATV
jgi:hypothetical protein